MDIANAKPGQGHVIPQASGHLTITNTTPSRNAALSFMGVGPRILLLWPRDELQARFGEQRCLFIEFKGVAYCFLTTLRFDLPNRQTGKASLGIGESVTLPLLDARTAGSFDSHAEPIARWVVDLLNSHQPPKLLIVTTDSNLLRSCRAGSGNPIAILNGDGAPLLAQGVPDYGFGSLPNCRDL